MECDEVPTVATALRLRSGYSPITNENRLRGTALHSMRCLRAWRDAEDGNRTPRHAKKGFIRKTTPSLIRKCVSNTVPCRVDIKVYALRCTPAPLSPPYTRKQDSISTHALRCVLSVTLGTV